MNVYQPGNAITLTVQFTTNATPPVNTDPTAIALRITDPNGVETVYTYALGQVTKDGVGQYSHQIDASVSGYWYYRWEGTGAVYAAQETRFLVSQSAFSNPQ